MRTKTFTKILCIILICCFSFLVYSSVFAKTIEETEFAARVKTKSSQKLVVEQIIEKNNEMKISKDSIELSSKEKGSYKFEYEFSEDFDLEAYFCSIKR